MNSSHRFGIFALGFVFTMLSAACASLESDSVSSEEDVECFYGCSDRGPNEPDASVDHSGGGSHDSGDDSLPLNGLCGEGSCHPDFIESCDESPAEATSRSFGEEGVDNPSDEPALPSNPRGDDEQPAKPSPPLPESCHVERGPNGPERSCKPAGMGEANAPCMASSDCAPGLACVGARHSGVCRPYCCENAEGCPSQTFCEAQVLREDAESEDPLSVPVCVPAMGCKLLEDEPCASMGLVCGIVRADGTTSCVAAGTGKLDEPCPCASGYVCAKSSNRCLKLCHVSQAAVECPSGTCQGGTEELPPGFGVCVGGYQDAG